MGKQQRELFDTQPPAWEIDAAAEQFVARVVFSDVPYGPFDYRVPDELAESICPGGRVRVPLGGGGRTVIGYCVALEYRSGGGRKLKDVRAVVDERQLLSTAMLQLTQWMAEYYLTPWGVVLDAVVPAGVRGQAGTRQTTFLSVPTNVVAKLTQLQLPPKQAQALKLLAGSAEPLTAQQLARFAKCSLVPIKGLIHKGLIREQSRRVQNLQVEAAPRQPEERPELNRDQQLALQRILAALHSGRHQTLLLHGVTGSGKTEVYMQAIQETIGFGRQAIVLVPEISLTPQTCQRFRSRFPHVAVLHSHLSDAERHWHWQQIAAGHVQVVVGARSAVFAPIPQLGMIVVDEEHDGSFKQDTAPRYSARDVAWQRARSEGVPLVLGSATPSLESWHRARQGQFELITLPRRVLDRPLPDVVLVDLRLPDAGRKRRGALSRRLQQEMERALRDGGQVILLLNRRGYSTSIQCPDCGGVVRCSSCDISLTHHRQENKAVCHYCDYTIPAPSVCPQCGSLQIRYAGFGTQKLEQEVGQLFPDFACLRMDSDTMQKPGSHEQALARFRSGEIKILLGTQMIAKGLDFPNVTLVGVVNADTALHFPEFRASERTFQLVTQVAGRTGRGGRGGLVVVQTFSPDHPALQAASKHDYETFAAAELQVREEFQYPPISSMIRLVVRGPVAPVAEQFAEHVVDQLRAAAAELAAEIRFLGPAPAPIARLHDKFRFHALLQGTDMDAMRAVVNRATDPLKPPEGVQWIVDVDPINLL
jgi:primosomal protein N' (replication factor Y)